MVLESPEGGTRSRLQFCVFRGRLRPRMHVQLLINPAQVVVHRVLTQLERLADFLDEIPLPHQFQNLQLARQTVESRRLHQRLPRQEAGGQPQSSAKRNRMLGRWPPAAVTTRIRERMRFLIYTMWM